MQCVLREVWNTNTNKQYGFKKQKSTSKLNIWLAFWSPRLMYQYCGFSFGWSASAADDQTLSTAVWYCLLQPYYMFTTVQFLPLWISGNGSSYTVPDFLGIMFNQTWPLSSLFFFFVSWLFFLAAGNCSFAPLKKTLCSYGSCSWTCTQKVLRVKLLQLSKTFCSKRKEDLDCHA